VDGYEVRGSLVEGNVRGPRPQRSARRQERCADPQQNSQERRIATLDGVIIANGAACSGGSIWRIPVPSINRKTRINRES